MYKNLNAPSLGIIGRQSELIELTLTYSFGGLDLEARELLKRAGMHGADEAARYLRSGNVKVGGWTQPINVTANEVGFAGELDRLSTLANLAKEVGFSYCTIDVEAGSDDLPFHENFERHRDRLGKVADVLGKLDIRLGVGFKAAPIHRQGLTYPFIHQAEELLTLVKTTANSNMGLALDTWNWRLGGGSLDQLDDLTGDQIVSVVIAEICPEADLQKIEDDQRVMPSPESLEKLGEFVASLAKRDYAGPVTLKPHPSDMKNLNRDRSVEKCARILDTIWVKAGLSKPKYPVIEAPAPPAETPVVEAETQSPEPAKEETAQPEQDQAV